MLAVALKRSYTRDRVRRELSGWLELLTVGGDRHELSPAVRDPLARRALTTLERLCDEDRQTADFQYLEGLIWRIMERHNQAIPPLRRSAELEPEKIGRWLALAWCYKRTGQIELAIDSLLEAREFEPGEAIIHYNLACYWSLAGHFSKALESLAIAFELDEKFRELVADEQDFDAIRGLPEFRRLCSVIV